MDIRKASSSKEDSRCHLFCLHPARGNSTFQVLQPSETHRSWELRAASHRTALGATLPFFQFTP